MDRKERGKIKAWQVEPINQAEHIKNDLNNNSNPSL